MEVADGEGRGFDLIIELLQDRADLRAGCLPAKELCWRVGQHRVTEMLPANDPIVHAPEALPKVGAPPLRAHEQRG